MAWHLAHLNQEEGSIVELKELQNISQQKWCELMFSLSLEMWIGLCICAPTKDVNNTVSRVAHKAADMPNFDLRWSYGCHHKP
jgi:hypothetical protein